MGVTNPKRELILNRLFFFFFFFFYKLRKGGNNNYYYTLIKGEKQRGKNTK